MDSKNGQKKEMMSQGPSSASVDYFSQLTVEGWDCFLILNIELSG